MNKPKLIVVVGISASGKTTIAKQLSKEENCVIVSSDSIRKEILGDERDQSKNEEVFKIFHKRIKDFLIDGQSVIAEATNINLKARRAIFDNLKNIECNKIAYIIPKTLEHCIDDNIYKENPVPHHVIERQMMNFQIPFIEEGFDEIKIHDFQDSYVNYDFIKDTILRMKNFDQKNPHHNQNLLDHCIYTWELFIKKYPYIYGADIHDIGKLFTQKQDENGVCHYYQHENVGAYYLLSHYNDILRSTTMSEKEILDMIFLVNYHMMPMNWHIEKTHKKWKRIFGEYKYKMLLYFNQCDKARPEEA